MLYDKCSRGTVLRFRPLACGRRPFCGARRKLPGAISAALETGLATTHALQPQVALGAERIHGINHLGFWNIDIDAAQGPASRRSLSIGNCVLYRDLLDDSDSGGRVLFPPCGLAQRKSFCGGTRSADASVRRACVKLSRTIHLAHAAEERIGQQEETGSLPAEISQEISKRIGGGEGSRTPVRKR